MKANSLAKVSAQGAPSIDDTNLMARLSALHGAIDRVERERDEMLGPLVNKRRRVEQLATRIDIDARRLEEAASAVSGSSRTGADVGCAELEEDRVLLARSKADLAQAVAAGKPKLDGLAEKRAALEEDSRRLARGLSTSGARVYASLLNTRKRPFIVPLNGDWCGGCYMRLPSSFISEIRRTGGICPFCKCFVSPLSLAESA